MIIDKLIERINEKNNPTVVGLDPQIDFIPKELLDKSIARRGETLEAMAEVFYDFNASIIDAVYDIVPAVKLQIAMYEQLGVPGLNCYINTIIHAKKRGLIVIGDVKRSDIASTASFYSKAHLGKVFIGNKAFSPFEADFITINPYLGEDSITPFLEDCKEYDKGIFVLVKTSNPGGGLFQNLVSDGKELYRHVGEFVQKIGSGFTGEYGYSSVGAVVGATYPEQLVELRRLMPSTFFLIPGYGAQGGSANNIKGAFDESGTGAIINSSRGIIAAHKKSSKSYEQAARDAAFEMKRDLNAALGRTNND